MSSGKATLHELDTVYGIEDMYDLLEIIVIDAHNQKLIIDERNRNADHSR